MNATTKLYRGYHVQPAEIGMWSWTHADYDGPEDRRCGIGKDEAECRAEVDHLISELAGARLTIIANDLARNSAETTGQKAAEAIRALLWNVSTATLLKIVDALADFREQGEAQIYRPGPCVSDATIAAMGSDLASIDTMTDFAAPQKIAGILFRYLRARSV